MARRAGAGPTMIESTHHAMGRIRADYQAMKPSRFRRDRHGLGGSGDAHYTSPSRFNYMREYARDMDRNDAIVGALLDRAADNIVHCGFKLQPQTGDRTLDDELLGRWDDWAEDPQACSATGEEVFADIEWLAARQTFLDGDIFAIFQDDGRVQLVEGDRAQTPSRTRQNVVHGIKLGPKRERLEYWFTRDPGMQRTAKLLVRDMHRVPAYEDVTIGDQVVRIPIVAHTHFARRATQTRGVTAFAPVFDKLAMIEDVELARLVQQEMVSAFAVFLKRNADFNPAASAAGVQLGARTAATAADGNTQYTEEISPGIFLKGQKGEELEIPSANIPGPQFFDHMKHLLTLVGINLGVPLVLAMMDARETNFSGWRGAMNQAMRGFQVRQKRLTGRLQSRAYRWKVAEWASEPGFGSSAAKLLAAGKLFAHRFDPPGWPYIQPEQEAKADALQLMSLLNSPRGVHAVRGRRFERVVDETIEDYGNAIEKAITRAQEITERTGVAVSWREVLNWAPPDRLRGVLDVTGDGEPDTNAQHPDDEAEASV